MYVTLRTYSSGLQGGRLDSTAGMLFQYAARTHTLAAKTAQATDRQHNFTVATYVLYVL
jgi:hypothetical protein